MPRGVPLNTRPRRVPPFKNMDQSNIKGWLRSYLYENDCSIAELARRVGSPAEYLRHLLTDRRKYIVSGMLDRICNALAMTADERHTAHKLAAEAWGFRVMDYHYTSMRAAEELGKVSSIKPRVGRAQNGRVAA